MTWPFTSREVSGSALEQFADRMRGRASGTVVGRKQAMRHSVVWAATRLRADLISTMPADVYRRIEGVQVEQPKPSVFVKPGGSDNVYFNEWVYSSQVDLDSAGNTVGIVLERDGHRLPRAIELVDIDSVSFIGRGSKVEKVRVGDRDEYDYADVWHEKQHTRSGSGIGLSPIAHAAAALSNHQSAQEFAAEWFGNSTVPGGHLKNTNRKLNKAEATAAKDSFKASVAAGDIWASGNDWEYNMLSAKASESAFLEMMKATHPDLCRFFGVPGDMIDVATDGQSVTYANITQRNLQLLIMNLGPAMYRRETAWSYGLLPQPRYVKLNPNALLRMDLKTRYEAHKVGIDGRFLAPSEVRDLEDRAPFTDDQLAEFSIFAKAPTPAPTTTPKEGQ